MLKHYIHKEKTGVKFHLTYKCKLQKWTADGEEEERVIHFSSMTRRLMYQFEYVYEEAMEKIASRIRGEYFSLFPHKSCGNSFP